MIWLIGAHFDHDHPYHVNDFMRPLHHRPMKQRAQQSFKSQENVDAIFMFMD